MRMLEPWHAHYIIVLAGKQETSRLTPRCRLHKKGGMLQEDGGYMYANKRYFIPWGWYSNAVGSLCSTSWSIFNKYEFNPFILGGGIY